MRKFIALILMQLLITVSAYADENLGSLGGAVGDSIKSSPNSIKAETGNNDYLETTINRISDGTNWMTAAWRIQRKVDVTKMGYIQFGPYWDDTIIFGYDNSDKMVMDKNGNFGIGNNNPQFPLDVSGIIYSNSSFRGQSYAPGLFLDETDGTHSAFMVLDGGYLGIQRRASNFGAYEATPFKVSLNAPSSAIVVHPSGNVGIGTTNPLSKLAVNGTITAREVKVTTTGWSDYVFEENYELKPLDQVEAFIQTNKHLPDIPSEKQVKAEGLAMADMMAKQMAKIEELTLYLIEQDKKMSRLMAENEALKKRVEALEQ